MLYNASDPRGINLRLAPMPWGPWIRRRFSSIRGATVATRGSFMRAIATTVGPMP